MPFVQKQLDAPSGDRVLRARPDVVKLAALTPVGFKLEYQLIGGPNISIATKIQPFSQGGWKGVVESLAFSCPQYGC